MGTVYRCETCGYWTPRHPWDVGRFGPRCKWCTKDISMSENRSHGKRRPAPEMWPAVRPMVNTSEHEAAESADDQ